MIRYMLQAAATVMLVSSFVLLPPDAPAQDFKGKLEIGIHRVNLKAGQLYEILLEATGQEPGLTSEFSQGLGMVTNLTSNSGKQKRYCLPARSAEFTFFVVPHVPFGRGPENRVSEYTLKFKSHALAEKPLLSEKGQLTEQDPSYDKSSLGRAHYKAYKVALKAGQIYVIDLVKNSQGLDPYLHLEGSDGKIVASDDDSGGDLNARVIYTPALDGEFRIIATALGQATGDFTLTVRNAQ